MAPVHSAAPHDDRPPHSAPAGKPCAGGRLLEPTTVEYRLCKCVRDYEEHKAWVLHFIGLGFTVAAPQVEP